MAIYQTTPAKIPVKIDGADRYLIAAQWLWEQDDNWMRHIPTGNFDEFTAQADAKQLIMLPGTPINDIYFQDREIIFESGYLIKNDGGYPYLFAPDGSRYKISNKRYFDTGYYNKPAPEVSGASCFYAYINPTDKKLYAYMMGYNGMNSSPRFSIFGNQSRYTQALTLALQGKKPEPIIPEPWGPESKPGGGGGTFDPKGDEIQPPSTPGAGAAGSGFVTLYTPTIAQTKQLYDFLWSDLVSVDSFKKLFSDPMECAISFGAIPALSKSGTQKNIYFGNVDTGIQSVTVGQYQRLDCGEIEIKEFFGSALDYAPYTQLSLYLPYIGYQELNVNDFMGKNLGIQYTVDMLSGACVAFVKAGTTVIGQYTGNCLSPIPLTARDQSDIYSGALTAASAAVGAIAIAATAGAAAPAVGGAITSAGTASAAGTAAAAGGMAKGVALAGGAITAANIATSSKPHYQRAGSINGASGILSVQTPYIIIERPDQSLAHDYNKFVGYPSNLTLKLGDLTGFTQVESVRLDGFAGASAAEISELDSLLKGGVIL